MSDDSEKIKNILKSFTGFITWIFENKLLMTMIILYSVFLIVGTKNIVEHNTRVIMCQELNMIPIVGEECITKMEYQNRLKVANTMNKTPTTQDYNFDFNNSILEGVNNG